MANPVPFSTKAFLRTQDGNTIELDATARTGTITIDGASYPVSDEAPAASAGRKLETAAEPLTAPTLTARQLATRHTDKRFRRRRVGRTGGQREVALRRTDAAVEVPNAASQRQAAELTL